MGACDHRGASSRGWSSATHTLQEWMAPAGDKLAGPGMRWGQCACQDQAVGLCGLRPMTLLSLTMLALTGTRGPSQHACLLLCMLASVGASAGRGGGGSAAVCVLAECWWRGSFGAGGCEGDVFWDLVAHAYVPCDLFVGGSLGPRVCSLDFLWPPGSVATDYI